MHKLRGLLIVLACARYLLFPQAACAQSTYESLVQEAISRAAAGEHEMAHMLFANAHEVSPSARTLRGMGVASFGAGHYARAITELTAALYHLEKPLDQRLELATRELIARASKFVCIVHLTLTPATARVLLDEQPVTSDHVEGIPLTPGTHVLRVLADGHTSQSLTIEAVAATEARFAFNLEKVLPPSASPAQAPILVPSVRTAEPSSSAPARKPWSRTARIAASTSFALALTGAAIAGGLWWKGNQRLDALSRECTQQQAGSCPHGEGSRKLSDLELARWERTIDAMIAVGAVGAGAALAVTAWELTNRRKQQTKLSVQMQGTALTLRGTF